MKERGKGAGVGWRIWRKDEGISSEKGQVRMSETGEIGDH